jgi:hypothetical protein
VDLLSLLGVVSLLVSELAWGLIILSFEGGGFGVWIPLLRPYTPLTILSVHIFQICVIFKVKLIQIFMT